MLDGCNYYTIFFPIFLFSKCKQNRKQSKESAKKALFFKDFLSILLGALAKALLESAAEGIDRAITQKLGDGGYGEDVFRDMQSCKLKAALAIIGYQTF